jgi:hypothetical protein
VLADRRMSRLVKEEAPAVGQSGGGVLADRRMSRLVK